MRSVRARDMAHGARNAGAFVTALFAALIPLQVGSGGAVPTQIHSESEPLSFVAAAAASGPQAFVRMRDTGPLFVSRAGASGGDPVWILALVGSFTLIAVAAGATRRQVRRRAHTQLAVAPSRSPPLGSVT